MQFVFNVLTLLVIGFAIYVYLGIAMNEKRKIGRD